MTITKLKSQDEPYYDRLASEHGTIFNTQEWTRIFGNGIQRYGIYNKGGELIGGFTIYSQKHFGFSVYRNPLYTPDIGPFLKINASNPVSIMDRWKRTLTLMADFFEKLPYSVISFSLSRNVLDMQPFIWSKFKVTPVYTYILDLSLSIDDIWRGMSNERRKNVNKSAKDGLLVRKIDNLDTIKSLVLKTYSRQEKKTNEFYLNKVLFEFANSSNSFAYVTYQNDKAIACSFCIYDKHTAYYVLGGYDDRNKHHGAGTMSMWEAIQYAKKMGLKYFDFEGSMNPKIERYFRGFGGQLTSCYQINKAILPLEILLKFYRRDLF